MRLFTTSTPLSLLHKYEYTWWDLSKGLGPRGLRVFEGHNPTRWVFIRERNWRWGRVCHLPGVTRLETSNSLEEKPSRSRFRTTLTASSHTASQPYSGWAEIYYSWKTTSFIKLIVETQFKSIMYTMKGQNAKQMLQNKIIPNYFYFWLQR